MKLKYLLEAVEMGDEIIVVPVGENAKEMQGVMKINKEGKEIIELLGKDTTENAIVEALAAKYENSKEDLQEIVSESVEQLRVFGMIVD